MISRNSCANSACSSFLMNGYLWRVLFVDEGSTYLIDRTGLSRLATTDPGVLCVFLSRGIPPEMMRVVLTHELGHCVMFSYGLLEQLHILVSPRHWVEAEEWVCNFLADYGDEVFHIANRVMPHISVA